MGFFFIHFDNVVMYIVGTGNGTAKCLYGNMDVVTAVLHIITGQYLYHYQHLNIL